MHDIFINLRLLFRDESVSAYRIVGGVDVYLLLALVGALTLEVIHAATGVSLGGNVLLRGTDEHDVHFIYFSLTSLTTVGVLFPAIVIARLVGLASAQN